MLEIVAAVMFVMLGVAGFVGIGLLLVVALKVSRVEQEKEMAIEATILRIQKSIEKLKKEGGD